MIPISDEMQLITMMQQKYWITESLTVTISSNLHAANMGQLAP